MMNDLISAWRPELIPLVAAIIAAIAGVVLNFVAFAALRQFANRTGSILYGSVVRHCYGPSRLIVAILMIQTTVPLVEPFPQAMAVAQHFLFIGMVVAIAWLIIRATSVATDVILARYDVGQKDNLQARKILTQIDVLKRAVAVVTVVLALSVAMMSFGWARELGASLLASAGIIGIIAGVAARPTIANLVAGIQLALSEPIRIDDVVIVENEWGRIEEITTTYVVVRIWDLRRLIVPLSYFIQQPFQNWTRVTADLLGTVFFYVDYTAPIEEIRQELHRILQGSKKWDGKVWNLQVTNTTEHTVELRALVSAADSSLAWDLRCEVREKLLEFIQRKYPECLPKARAQVGNLNAQVSLPQWPTNDGPQTVNG